MQSLHFLTSVRVGGPRFPKGSVRNAMRRALPDEYIPYRAIIQICFEPVPITRPIHHSSIPSAMITRRIARNIFNLLPFQKRSKKLMIWFTPRTVHPTSVSPAMIRAAPPASTMIFIHPRPFPDDICPHPGRTSDFQG